MKNLFFLFLLGSLMNSGPLVGQVTKKQALDFITESLLGDEMNHVLQYAPKNLKSGNDKLVLIGEQDLEFPYDSNWVFFVDDHPLAKWNHPVRYIIINSEAIEYVIADDRRSYPVSLDDDFDRIQWNIDYPVCNPIYPQPTPSWTKVVPPNPHLYAVIIGGIEDPPSRKPQTWNDISAIYTTLEQAYGYMASKIFVHYYTGSSLIRGSDLDCGDISDDIDYAAYKDTIYRTFKCLAGLETDPAIPKLSPDDQLLVYVDDHGDMGGSYAFIMLPPDPYNPSPFINLYDTTFARWVRDITCGQMVFLLEQCYSGGFMNDLQTHSGDKCKNRSIYTSAANESEWMDMHVSDTLYGEFTFYWTSAIRGYFPDLYNNRPWALGFPVYDTTNYPEFPYKTCFGSCQNHPYFNPDLNRDGYVTMEEAFYFANGYDSWS